MLMQNISPKTQQQKNILYSIYKKRSMYSDFESAIRSNLVIKVYTYEILLVPPLFF